MTVTLLEHLDRTRFRPALALVRMEGERLPELPEDVPVYALNARRVATCLPTLVRLLRRERPDILFSTASGTNAIAVMAARLAGTKTRVVVSERNVLLHGQVTLKKRAMLRLKRLKYARADGITAVSEGVRADLVKRLGLAPERIAVVYNPIVTDDMEVMAGELPAHPWFAEDVPVVLGCGRLVEEKDFETLIRAFGLVRGKQRARLVILGDGPLRAKLDQQVREAGLENDVAMPGFVANPFAYMARCSVFVLSSRFEGLPGVLIQAMACGAPVVATDCPSGPSEIITPNADGLLVPVGDASEMAEAIHGVLSDPASARAMGQRGKVSVERFRVERVMERYAAALEGSEATQ